MSPRTSYAPRLLLIAMAVCLALGIALLKVSPGGASNGTTLNVQGGQIPSGQSASAAVSVSLVAADTMNAFDVTLAFNPDVVNVSSVTLASGWSALPTEAPDNVAGTVTVAGLQLGEGCLGGTNCPLFSITWQAVGSGAAQVAAQSFVLAGSNNGTLGTLTGVSANVGALSVAGSAETPATQAPSTQAPATQAPETQSPATQAPATQAPAATTTQSPPSAPATSSPAAPAAPIAPVSSPTSLAGQPNITGPILPPSSAAAQPTAPVVVVPPQQPDVSIPVPSSGGAPSPVDFESPASAGQPESVPTVVPLPPQAGNGFANAVAAPLSEALGKSFIALAAVLGGWLLLIRFAPGAAAPTLPPAGDAPMSRSDLEAIGRYLADAEQRGRVNAPRPRDPGSTSGGGHRE